MRLISLCCLEWTRLCSFQWLSLFPLHRILVHVVIIWFTFGVYYNTGLPSSSSLIKVDSYTVVLMSLPNSLRMSIWVLAWGVPAQSSTPGPNSPCSHSSCCKCCQLCRKEGISSRKAAVAESIQTNEIMDSMWITSKRSIQQLIQES